MCAREMSFHEGGRITHTHTRLSERPGRKLAIPHSSLVVACLIITVTRMCKRDVVALSKFQTTNPRARQRPRYLHVRELEYRQSRRAHRKISFHCWEKRLPGLLSFLWTMVGFNNKYIFSWNDILRNPFSWYNWTLVWIRANKSFSWSQVNKALVDATKQFGQFVQSTKKFASPKL